MVTSAGEGGHPPALRWLGSLRWAAYGTRESAAGAGKGAQAARRTPPGMPKQVLIVDAALQRWEQLTGWLQAEGYRVEHATDGRQAIRRIRESGFAAAIVALDLPEADLALTVRRLAHIGEVCNPGVAIVLVEPVAPTALQAGQREQLMKTIQDLDLPHNSGEERR